MNQQAGTVDQALVVEVYLIPLGFFVLCPYILAYRRACGGF